MTPAQRPFTELLTRVALTLVALAVLGGGRGVQAARPLERHLGDLSSLTLEELLDLSVRPWETLEARRSLRMTGSVAYCAGAATLGGMLDLMGLDAVLLPGGATQLVPSRAGLAQVSLVELDGRPLGLAGVLPAPLLARPAREIAHVQMLLLPGGARADLVIHVTLAGEEGDG